MRPANFAINTDSSVLKLIHHQIVSSYTPPVIYHGLHILLTALLFYFSKLFLYKASKEVLNFRSIQLQKEPKLATSGEGIATGTDKSPC